MHCKVLRVNSTYIAHTVSIILSVMGGKLYCTVQGL